MIQGLFGDQAKSHHSDRGAGHKSGRPERRMVSSQAGIGGHGPPVAGRARVRLEKH
jgi:hypothetical protein